MSSLVDCFRWFCRRVLFSFYSNSCRNLHFQSLKLQKQTSRKAWDSFFSFEVYQHLLVGKNINKANLLKQFIFWWKYISLNLCQQFKRFCAVNRDGKFTTCYRARVETNLKIFSFLLKCQFQNFSLFSRKNGQNWSVTDRAPKSDESSKCVHHGAEQVKTWNVSENGGTDWRRLSRSAQRGMGKVCSSYAAPCLLYEDCVFFYRLDTSDLDSCIA